MFQALRKTMYLRRVKLDKLRELINNPTKNTPVRKAPEPPGAATYKPPFGAPYNVSGASAAPVNSWDTPPNLPYPLKPTMAMPSPNFR